MMIVLNDFVAAAGPLLFWSGGTRITLDVLVGALHEARTRGLKPRTITVSPAAKALLDAACGPIIWAEEGPPPADPGDDFVMMSPGVSVRLETSPALPDLVVSVS